MSINSISNRLVSGLATWRNPQGNEVNWLRLHDDCEGFDALNLDDVMNPSRVPIDNYQHGKIIVANIGFALLGVASIVEMVVYGTLGLLISVPASLIIGSIKPFAVFIKIILYSGVTAVWALGSIRFPVGGQIENIPTDIRLVAVFIGLYMQRQRPGLEVRYLRVYKEWIEKLIKTIRLQGLIPQGRDFLLNEVLPQNPSEEVVEAFKDMYSEKINIINFVLTKSIYIYALGSKKTEKVPYFFKKETRADIEAFRRQFVNLSPEVLRELHPFIDDPVTFSSDSLFTDAAQFVINRLRGIATDASQGGKTLLLQPCWIAATGVLNAQSPEAAV